MKKRGMFGFDDIPAWLIALIVLGIMIFFYVKFSQKGNSLIDFFKNTWRFGR